MNYFIIDNKNPESRNHAKSGTACVTLEEWHFLCCHKLCYSVTWNALYAVRKLDFLHNSPIAYNQRVESFPDPLKILFFLANRCPTYCAFNLCEKSIQLDLNKQ